MIPNVKRMYESMGKSSPKLARGMVWCKKCGRSQRVDSGECIRIGWPKCCGHTMTIDSPEERRLSTALTEERKNDVN